MSSSQLTLMTMEKKESHIKNLHQAEIDWHGKHKFWYVGTEKDFSHLVKEIFFDEDYGHGVTKDMVVIDAGAYIGMTAFYFYEHVKKIYAIEPYEPAFECLKRNIKENKMDKVEAFKLAIADCNGKTGLYPSSNLQGPSTNIMLAPGVGGVEVEGVTFAKFFKDNKINHVDLLKMDIEGMEYKVLDSEGFLSAADKIDRIIIEGHPDFSSVLKGLPWLIPHLLYEAGFNTQPLTTRNLIVDYPDGSREEKPLVMFLAERRK